MRPTRLAALALLASALLAVVELPTVGQTTPRSKPKPGAPLAPDPAAFPKAGTPLNRFALVERPAPLKGVRSWTLEAKRHRWTVAHLAARPDGKTLATSGHDGVVRLWDAETGAFQRALFPHEAYAPHGLAWSPDGNYLAAAVYSATYVWDARTGLPVRVLRDTKAGAVLVAWSPDGTRLLTGGGGSGRLAVWDVAAGKQVAATEYGQPIQGIAYSPTGEYVAAAASRAGTYVADPADLKTVHTFKEVLDTDHAVAFSPDGGRLAGGSTKTTILYDLAAGRLVQKLEIGAGALAWTPAGGLLVVKPQGWTVTPHAPADLAAGKALPGNATAVSLAADGRTLFGLYAGRVTRWDLETGSAAQSFPVGEYLALECGPSTAVLVPGSPPALWDPATGKRIGGLDGHTGNLGPVAWSANGKALAAAGADRVVRVYETATARPVGTLSAPTAVRALALANDGKVAALTADRKVTVWPAGGTAPAHTLAGPRSPVVSGSRNPPALAWSRDGRFLAAAGGKEILVWAADTGKQIRALEHPRDVRSVTWSPDGSRLVVGSSEDVALAFYQSSTWKLQPALDKGANTLVASAAAWSPDGGTLLGHRSAGNKSIQTWNAKTGRLGAGCVSSGGASTYGYWPDGRTIAGGGIDRAARFFDAGSGRLRFTVVADRDQLWAVSAEGHHRVPEATTGEVVAVVLTDRGQETLPVKEFAARYGFRNAPGNAK